jgi:chloramphenicol 3-O-phosphotransferase
MSQQLVILSGAPNVGKTATAEALCQRYDRMLHVEVTVLRDFLRMGRLRPWDESPEGRRQRVLLIESACDMACRFLNAGYGVLVDDIVLPDDLAVYRRALAPCQQAVHFIVLTAPLAVVVEREKRRPTEWHQGRRLEEVHQALAGWQGVATVGVDALTPELVADRVMAVAAEGRALLSDVPATA